MIGRPGGSAVARGALAVAAATLLVKLLGLAKEATLAAVFGSSSDMDALSLSLLVPQTLASLLASSVPLALIPAYFAARSRSGDEAADALFRAASTATVLVLAVLSAAIAAFSGPIAAVVAGGHSAERAALTARLLSGSGLVLAAAGAVACLRARLFAEERFAAGAVGPALVSLAVLAVLLFPSGRTAEAVVLAILAGFAAKAAFLALALRRAGIALPFGFSLRAEGLSRFLTVSVPIVIGTGVVSLNALVDQCVASRLPEGSVASLRFADQVLQIPVALVAVAISTAAFPVFSRTAASGDLAGLKRAFSGSVRSVLIVALPASAVLVAVPDVVVSLLFERGAFDAASTAGAAAPLRFYGLALPFLAYGYVNGRAYNALGENGVLVKVGAATLGLNLVLDLALVGPFGLAGIAASTVLAQGAAALALFALLARRIGPVVEPAAVRSIARGVASALALGLVLFVLERRLSPTAGGALLVLAAAVPAALGLGLVFHRAEISSLVVLLRRRP